VAYDDRNVIITKDGIQLNSSLVFKKIPWVQYYVGALSIALFGNDAGGLRILFTAVGLLAFFPIYAILRRSVRCPEVIAALALLAPQVVLFQRNARYYSILILLYAILVWLLSVEFKSAKLRFCLATLVLFGMFHSHSLAAMCCCAALILYCAAFDRKSLLLFGLSATIACGGWLIWYELLGPSLIESDLSISNLTSDFSAWFHSFISGAAAVLVDLDVVDSLPILLWILLIPILLWRNRAGAVATFKRPIPAFVLINIAVQALATAAIFGYETPNKYALLRYMPHLIVFAIVSSFVLLSSLITRASLYAIACTLMISLNLLTLSYWTRIYSREVPLSWAWPVYCEVFRPRDSVWDKIVNEFRSQPKNPSGQEANILAIPPWTQVVFDFYLGDLFLIPPTFDRPSEKCSVAIREALGEESYNRLKAQPEWIVVCGDAPGYFPDGYEIYTVFSSERSHPDDGNRPELTRHVFFRPDVATKVTCFRLRKKS
jgi:hypothetical protein